MINVVFVCHGNICRSPMAEYLFKYYVSKKGKSHLFNIESRATSYEEIGNPIHYGTRRILDQFNIDYKDKRAKRIEAIDYNKYDYILLMDQNNIYNIKRIINNDPNNKIHLLLEYANINKDIADPWYTHNFDDTYNDIMIGIKAFYDYLIKEGKI